MKINVIICIHLRLTRTVFGWARGFPGSGKGFFSVMKDGSNDDDIKHKKKNARNSAINNQSTP